MRVVPCMLLMLLLCTTSTGCSLFKKNTTGGSGPEGGTAPAKFPGAKPDPLVPTPPPNFPPAASAAVKGGEILAGTVTDAYHHPIGNAYIRLVNLEDSNPGAPIDVASDSGGHFLFQGLKPGVSYKLIARTKQGDKMLAGTVLTNAPNPRVLISIREDLANADTPPLPGSPAIQKPVKTEETSNGQTQWNNTQPNPKGPVNELPATINVPTNTQVGNPTPSNSGDPAYLPGFAEMPKQGPPVLKVPTPPRPDPIRPPTPGDAKLDTGPTRVPSCLLLGNHVENLALKDSKGQTWEYKNQAAGKLVLIDFWGTHCLPCKETMPTLSRLHSQYGPRGLEVIGIALEPARDERRDVANVNAVCASMQVNYRQLMGHTGSFDLAKEFKVKGLPTLILLSETGDIIYHHEGRPDASEVRVLEGIIQRRLK
jgi:thiol-disulfide isomerase/thioredoxin